MGCNGIIHMNLRESLLYPPHIAQTSPHLNPSHFYVGASASGVLSNASAPHHHLAERPGILRLPEGTFLLGGKAYSPVTVDSRHPDVMGDFNRGKYVKTVGKGAFQGCKKLKSVTVGKSVRTIGSKAFYKDGKLKSVAFKGKSVKKVGSKAFKGISKKAVIKAPKSKKKAYQKRVRKAGAPKSVRVKWRHPGMKRSRAFRSMREALFTVV